MKKRYILTFPPNATNKAIIWELIKKYDIKINIIKANINSGEEGSLLLEMEASKKNLVEGLDYISESGISCLPVDKSVKLDIEKCIHCGSCTAVCFALALTINKDDARLNFDTEKCIVCELCTTACPLDLFTIHFGD